MRYRILCLVIVAMAAATTAAAETVIVKLGTLAPEGSVWHDALLEVRQKWRDLTNAEVELRIYAGGVLGDEGEMVRKLRRRGLDAVAITGLGLPAIDRSIDVLNIPLLFESYDELDHVRSKIAPELERRMEARGFKVLSWVDAGWVYFFTKSPVVTPEDLRALRLWTSSVAPEAEKLYKEFGFKVVPLPVTETLTGLQTGLIEAVDVPPLYALLDRSYQSTGYMTDVRWAPLNAATVISVDAWNRIPAKYHEALLQSVRDVLDATQAKIREADERAIEEMKSRGLTVVAVDAETRVRWRDEARNAYPALRASSATPELFDEVLRLSDAYKSSNADGAGSGGASP